MNRNKLFVSALLMGITVTEHTLSAHESKAKAESSAARRSTPPIRHQAHPEAKCGRCEGNGGRSKEVHIANHERETFGRNGHVPEGHPRGVDIRHDRDEARERRLDRREHSFERSYSYHGHEFDHRVYYVHGIPYHHFYQPYYYRGIRFHVYTPGFYYAPAFYGWAYTPWAAPVAWEWGWREASWYRYYGAWFRPYPVYNSASLWLTDYLVAQTLEQAYEEREAAARLGGAVNFASGPITPDVKRAIAAEVRRQLALENAEAAANSQGPPDPGSSGLARMLSDNTSHVFVVATGLEVMSGVGACPITEGDVIQLNGPTPPNAVTANLVVLASKGQDCRKGAMVAVGLADLQEMQNHMRATIDHGLRELQSKQGQGGLPAAPLAATKPPMQTEFAAIAPPPDPNDEKADRK